MSDKIELLSMSLEEIRLWLKGHGFETYRAKQLMGWLLSGASFSEMHNLPSNLIEFLSENAYEQPVQIIKRLVSKKDGTEKYLFSLVDGSCIEGVLMPYRHGNTLCISTQVGCNMGCRFCASTLNGKKRNLSAGEMLGQVVSVNRLHREKTVQNVVMMGSGEPLDNYNNVLKFIRLISLSEGLNISQRRITLSTCGLADKIRSLADERLAITLSVSLHASNDDIRQSLMPIARRYSIKELISACKHYISLTHRRVSFEYALIKGVNDGQEHAEELCQILRGFQCHVNLITLNAVDETDYVGSDRFAANKFFNYLNEKNIAVSMRRTMGEDIQGACGQLRNEFIKGEG